MRVLVLLSLLGSLPAAAQQSLFNVPSTTGTPPASIFVQEQLNLLAETGESNLTLNYGLIPGLEMGVNIFHVDLYGTPHGTSARAMFMLNSELTLEPVHGLTVQAGGQLGMGFRKRYEIEPVGLGWTTARLALLDDLIAATGGVYVGSPSFVGHGNLVGPMAGFEVELFPDVLHLQGDMMFGSNEAAVGVIGAVFFLPAGLQISAGLQVPSPGSHNAYGLCIELTRVPDDPGHKHLPPHQPHGR